MPRAGTLTLLFTDLVGSTESLVALGEERYDSVRDEHDALVGGTIAAHRGEIVKHTGDGYMATFHQAADAVAAACLSPCPPGLTKYLRVGTCSASVWVNVELVLACPRSMTRGGGGSIWVSARAR